MSLRREFMNYVGTGAIGGIAGYYVGAQELLGIQSDNNPTEQQPPEQSPEERNFDNSGEQDNTQTGNTFSIEAATQGEVRLSESVQIENLGTSQPDIIIGTPFRTDDTCRQANYNATVSEMTMSDGSNNYNIVNTSSVTDFNRANKSKEVYSNPVNGSENWEFSFNIDLGSASFFTPDHYHCTARLEILLTEEGDWFDNSGQIQRPENTIRYYIQRSQGSKNIRHGVSFHDDDLNYDGELIKGADDFDSTEDYDWYEENTEWNITITRR